MNNTEKILEKIKVILNEEERSTGEIYDMLRFEPSINSSWTNKNGVRTYRYSKRLGFYAPTMNQLGNLVRRVATKQGLNENKQQLWKIKEEYKNAMDRKIPAQ